MVRAIAIRYFLAAMCAMLVVGCSSGDNNGGKIGSWCQVDDPAKVESERKERKLTVAQLDEVNCAKPVAASQTPDELVVPMPCGRFMVFRAVRVAVTDALGSEVAQFGDPDPTDNFRRAISGPWIGEVAGGFPSNPDGTGTTAYYIGKYEVTGPQFAIFASDGSDYGNGSEACKRSAEELSKVRGTNVLPATNLSWAEANAFADRFVRWLIAHEQSNGGKGAYLPRRESRPGYFRLPTEAEWEFAARGADETGSTGRSYATSTGIGEMKDIAWFADVGQSPPDGSRTYPVGRKAPNRLMLYDMIGNAEELTSDLFRPVRPDGTLAGRPGGVVLRGGSAADGPDQVGAGVRREMELYDSDGPARAPTVGFRLVIAAPYFVNKQGLTGEMQGNPSLQGGIASAWTRREAASADKGQAERGAALDMIRTIRREDGAVSVSAMVDPNRLNALQRQIEIASAKAADAEARSTQELLLGAVMAAGYARERHGKIVQMEADVAEFSRMELSGQEQADLALIKSQLTPNQVERSATLAYYGNSMVELSRRPRAQVIGAQAVVKARLQRAGLSRLSGLFQALIRHVDQARAVPPTNSMRRNWYIDILTEKAT